MEQGLEYFGVLTGLLYLGLEIVQHRAMWIVGFVTSFVYIFVMSASVYTVSGNGIRERLYRKALKC